MNDIFNSPALRALRRTFRPGTLLTGGDTNVQPFPLPVPGGDVQSGGIFGAEPTLPRMPEVSPPEGMPAARRITEFDSSKRRAIPEILGAQDAVPPVAPEHRMPSGGQARSGDISMDANLVRSASGSIPDQAPISEQNSHSFGSRLNEIGGALSEGGEAVLETLLNASDAIGERVDAGREAVRQNEGMVRRQRDNANTRDSQLFDKLRGQAEQRDLDDAMTQIAEVDERKRAEIRKQFEALGDNDFDAYIEERLHRAHDMNPTEARAFMKRLDQIVLQGGDPARVARAKRKYNNIRQLGPNAQTEKYFPTRKFVEKLKHVEDGLLGKGVALVSPMSSMMRENEINETKAILLARANMGDQEARDALGIKC